jgi:phosphodiesterase/alkaline phosphatase D-like protein
VRGPYLQSVTTNSAIVRWRTDRPIHGSVSVLGGTNALWQDFVGVVSTTEHEMTLIDLEPDTSYFYAVGSAGTNLLAGSNYWFRTAPMTAKHTRIWVIGDCGTAALGRNEPLRVRDAYLAHAGTAPTDLWLMLGDNAYPSGTDAQYQAAVFNVYQELLESVSQAYHL